MPNGKRLLDKVAIITGAARGQGAEEARRFVEEGAKVMLTDIAEEGSHLATTLGENAVFRHHDVASETAWAEIIAEVVERWGRLDVLVNNAGIALDNGPIEDTTTENFDTLVRINQNSVFYGMRAAIPIMKANRAGSIVNISSAVGLASAPGMIGYTASKWAVTGMTQGTAQEVGEFGIRVNSVHPGLIETPMLSTMTQDALEARKAIVPLQRLGEVADVAELVVYLASDESRFMTGAAIPIDGGMVL